MKTNYALGLAALALLVLAGCAPRPEAPASAPSASAAPCGVAAVDKSLPDFTFVTLDGQSLSLAGLGGKVVVADLWAMQCMGCVEGLEHYQSDPELLQNPQVALVAFCMDKSEPAVRAFVKRKGFTFPVAMASDAVRRALGAEGRVVLPMIRLFDATGRLRYELGADQATPETVKCLVTHLLGESGPASSKP